MELTPDHLMLGVDTLDHNHLEFIDLQRILAASDTAALPSAFETLYYHTKAHFAEEEALMEKSGFAGLSEHRSEHEKLLGEMHYFLQKVQRGRSVFAKAYIQEYLPEKFYRHIINIDSQLAAYLKQHR